MPVQHLFVWTVAALATMMPLAADHGAYGREPTGECWLQTSGDHPQWLRVSFYAVLLVAMVAAGGLLGFLTLCGGRRRLLALPNGASLAARMMTFTSVFLATWTTFMAARAWGWATGSAAPAVMVLLHLTALSGNGMCNAMVWATTPAFRRQYVRSVRL